MSKLRNPKSEASVSSEAAVYIATLGLARAGRGGAGWSGGGDKPGLMQVVREICLSSVQLMVGQVRSAPAAEMSNNCQLCYELMDR